MTEAGTRLDGITLTSQAVGNAWSWLVMREALLHDVRRFAEFQARLGIARSTLSARLSQLVDNGLLTRLAAREKPSKITGITAEQWFRRPVAPTFHGRDIMAPVAARLSLGLDPDQLGPPLTELVQLDWPGAKKVAQRIDGEVTTIDSFGNLVTNISRDMLADVPTDESVTVACD